jgi:hypothetical protein
MASKLPFGPGSKLWVYWTVGEGSAKWLGSPTPWTTLRDLLIKAGVPDHEAPGLATNIMRATPEGRALFKAHH